jgi:dynein-related subfamily AAA family protein
MTSLVKEHECTIAEAALLLEILTDADDAVMIWGPPGVGKSDIVRQLGAKKKRKVIEFRTNIREPVDVRGIPVPCEKTGTTRWFVPDELPQVDRDGAEGYLFIDEINTGSPQMMAVMFGLVLDRRVGEYELPPGWKIVAAGNRVSDRASAQRMPTALRNRFAHIFVIADVKAWADWANANAVAPELVAFIRLRRDFLHVMPKGDENAFPTPRSWTRCSKYVGAVAVHRLRLFASHVGDAYASELDGFIELYKSMGSLEDIIQNPADAKLPTEASTRYAVCTGLARLATRKTMPAIIQYAERLPRESQILVIHDATTRDESLKNTAAYGKWAVANQDLVIQ